MKTPPTKRPSQPGLRLRRIKGEIRVLGVDDGKLPPTGMRRVYVVGTVYRGGAWLDGVMATTVKPGGEDATRRIAHMVRSSPHHGQVRVVMLYGETFAGGNRVDIEKLHRRIGRPVIAYLEGEEAHGSGRAQATFEGEGRVLTLPLGRKLEGPHIRAVGLREDEALKLMATIRSDSSMPEAIRVSHIIARAINVALGRSSPRREADA